MPRLLYSYSAPGARAGVHFDTNAWSWATL